MARIFKLALVLGLIFCCTGPLATQASTEAYPGCLDDCQAQWVSCYTSCPACDQCSCQYSLCRNGCTGEPWQC
jgi:hypothetical protein